MPVAAFHEFKTRDELAETLASDIAERLVPDIERGQFASIALSGGSTPKLMLEKLGAELGDMKEMIYFALVDERYVSPDDERSNERMIRNQLKLDGHPGSEFLSLYQDDAQPDEACKIAEVQLLDDDELPFDVVALGMGLDGHTASFFSDADNLQLATNPDKAPLFVPINAPGAGETRITMTLPVIASATQIILHIEGAEKRAVYEKALKDGLADELPIRHVLRHPNAAILVYWAP